MNHHRHTGLSGATRATAARSPQRDIGPRHRPAPFWRGLRLGALVATLTGLAPLAGAAVVISAVYGGGGNSNALYAYDFVELRNTGDAPVDLSGWSLQYAATAGTSWSARTLSGSIPAKGFYLVQLASNNTAVGATLPMPDFANTGINLAAANGKLALRNSTVAITSGTSCPVGDASVVDFIGFGTANCFEGGAAAPAASAGSVLVRNAACADTNANSTDFSLHTSYLPRNSQPANTGAACGSSTGTGGGGGEDDLAVDRSIPAIQGSGSTSPLVGTLVRTTGVVTRVNSNGFFLQDLTGDGNPATSDGLFIFTNSPVPATAVVGHLLQVVGRVTEFNVGAASNAHTAARTVTELTSVSSINTLGTGYSIAPVLVSLPEATDDELERYEGMLVTLAGPLTVQQTYFQAQYGQVTLAVGGRLETPTNRWRPGSAQAVALADANARRRIILDDGSSATYPNPTPHQPAGGVLRGGDSIQQVTGIIDFGLATASNAGFGDYRIHPTAPLQISSLPRPAVPVVGGNVKVASFNVLNYFSTFTNGQTADGQSNQGCSLGNSTAAGNCRGANNLAEFQRQRAKIVAALGQLDADAVGLMEIQNNGNTATDNLVAALNASLGAGTYASAPLPSGSGATGTDAIRVAIIYKPAKLAPVGLPASDTDPVNNRPTLAQTFAARNGERFTLVVNHFKSKGSCPAAGDADAPGNLDAGDGQGCWNATRVAQAQQLQRFLAARLPATGSPHALLVGDFNAYAAEDPIAQFTSSGYTDLLAGPALAHSYVFDGAAGRLDHALASSSLAAKLSGAALWHINADEGPQSDYNLENRQPACATCAPDAYQATPYRSSDHDPVLVGLGLYATQQGGAGRDTLVGTPGEDILLGGPGADTLTGGAGADIFVYTSMRDAGDLITDFAPGEDRIDLRALLASINAPGATAVASGVLRWAAQGNDLVLMVDTDGTAGPSAARVLVTLRNVSAAAFNPARDLILQ